MRAFIFTGVFCTVVTSLPGQYGLDSDQTRTSTEQIISAAPADSIIANTYLLLHKGSKVIESWAEVPGQKSKVSTFTGEILKIRFLLDIGKSIEALGAVERLRRHTRITALTPLEAFELNYLTGQLYLGNRMPSQALHFFAEARRCLQAFQPEWKTRMQLYNDILHRLRRSRRRPACLR